MEGIVHGTIQSEYHRRYTSGTAKERYGLGNCMKFGPCGSWNTDRKVKLISHLENLAKEIVSVDGSQFQYARDVLLPEVCNCVDVNNENVLSPASCNSLNAWL